MEMSTMERAWLVGDSKFKTNFLHVCETLANSNRLYETFRRDPFIHVVMENTNEEWMRKAYAELQQTDPELLTHLDKFASSDLYGGPETFFIDGHILAPTTMRYIYTLGLLRKFFGSLDGKRIIEIGGGYGGQCKIIHDLYKPALYAIYDLPQVQKMARRYLDDFDIAPYFASSIEEKECDILIAWCSWSELDVATKKEYAEKVIFKAQHYFICSNYNMPEDMRILNSNYTQVFKNSLVENILIL